MRKEQESKFVDRDAEKLGLMDVCSQVVVGVDPLNARADGGALLDRICDFGQFSCEVGAHNHN